MKNYVQINPKNCMSYGIKNPDKSKKRHAAAFCLDIFRNYTALATAIIEYLNSRQFFVMW